MKALNPSTMSIEALLAAIKRLAYQGHTRREIGQGFTIPVTSQRVSQYLLLDRISAAHRNELFNAIDSRELGLDVAVKQLQRAHDAAGHRKAETYLLNRADQHRKSGKKISRGYNPVREDPDKRR